MILLRHGETQFNVVFGATREDPGIADPALTANGQAQAQAAAQKLLSHEVAQIVVSPYQRALETGNIIASTVRAQVRVEPLIRERYAFSCDVGTPRSGLMATWTGYSFDHLEETWWPAGEESEGALHARCRRFSDVMAENGDWRRTVVVTHWGVIRALTGRQVINGEMLRYDPTGRDSPAHRGAP